MAHDASGTIEQARHLWRSVHRDNVMIKVPATAAGLHAIEALIAEGINVNVTLLFSVERYREVFAAYIRGLGQNDQPRDVASVASFFVSARRRRDRPEARGRRPGSRRLHAAAPPSPTPRWPTSRSSGSATGADFQAQARRGARVQRPLWASTSTKDPNLSDTLYVDNLIGPDTVNTVPPKTLDAFVEHRRGRGHHHRLPRWRARYAGRPGALRHRPRAGRRPPRSRRRAEVRRFPRRAGRRAARQAHRGHDAVRGRVVGAGEAFARALEGLEPGMTSSRHYRGARGAPRARRSGLRPRTVSGQGMSRIRDRRSLLQASSGRRARFTTDVIARSEATKQSSAALPTGSAVLDRYGAWRRLAMTAVVRYAVWQ
ncbi:MAG: transaldolase family protein [Halofilum sp. (in: g-proteobacteria)]|nr:transaldolase family protein [Halofilum sp. (in: g-proteobacteria)]